MSKQYQDESGQFDNEAATTKQYQTESGEFVNEAVTAADTLMAQACL